MRPVSKKSPGEKVRYLDSQGCMVEDTIRQDYPQYKTAKMPLIGNLGNYCSYCEAYHLPADLAVEHIIPKKPRYGNPGSETAWDNFLLACNVCNSIKHNNNDLTLDNCHWPHRNNTFNDFVYNAGGMVMVNPALSEEEREKAQRLSDAVKLEAYPRGKVAPTGCDYRWKQRCEVWNVAERQRKSYKAGNITAAEVVDLAETMGYWSIWYTVFSDCPDVRNALTQQFPGTAQF